MAWTLENELAALQIEVTEMYLRAQLIQWGADPKELPEPLEIKRPGQETQKPEPVDDPSEIARWLAKNIPKETE